MSIYNQYQNSALLHLIAADDHAAFTELYDRFWKKLFAISYQRLQDVTAAEDVVHDVFASLWSARHDLCIEQLENYLATATKYTVFGKIRKQHHARTYSSAQQKTETEECKIEEAIHFKRVLEIIKTETENLPERCRLIFKCSREQGKSIRQIAAELSLSPKTVENQLSKALKHLRLATKNFMHGFFLLGFLSSFLP